MTLRSHHRPALDGVRALAVLAVLAYHLDAPWARGGFLGVDLFFVLSGFLISTLLLEERIETGRIALRSFWQRRARRLLPALFAMLAVVVMVPWLVTTFVSPTALAGFDLGEIRSGALASWFYVANWFAIVHGHSYFAQLALPSPLGHTWSLAIEEQFYLLWPLVTLVLVGRHHWRRGRGIVVTTTLAVASSLAMALLFHPTTAATNYVYNATFTRLFDLALGAALAWCMVRRDDLEQLPRWLGTLGLGVLGAWFGFVALAGNAQQTPWPWMFRGGFFVTALLGVGLVGAAMVPGPFSRVMSWRPLTEVGKVSYGLYLWHWPTIAYLSTTSTGLHGVVLLAARLGVMATLTVTSYHLVEQPIRQQRLAPRTRWMVGIGGSVASVLAIVIFTSSSMYPVANLQRQLALYAQTGTPQGAAHSISGHLDATWLAAQHFSPTHKYQVMVIGDSVPYYSQWGLDAALNAAPAIKGRVRAFVGFGLYQAKYSSWFLTQIATRHPQLVVVMLTFDEENWTVDPAGYHRAALAFFHHVFQLGVHDIAIATTPPAKGSIKLSTGVRANAANLNAGFRAFEATLVRELGSHALLLNLAPTLERHGAYATWLPSPRTPHAATRTWARVRMMDGVHFCQVGTELYASALTWDIATLAHLSSYKPGWETQPWWKKKLYYFPQGSGWCPNDHPR